jgi:hypothetical protein
MLALNQNLLHTKWRQLVIVIMFFVSAVVMLLTVMNFPRLLTESSELAQLESLHIVDTAQLETMSDGMPVAVEGRISERTPTSFRSLVAYVHTEGSQLYDHFWNATEPNTSPFILDVSDGALRIANRDYALTHSRGPLPDNYFGLAVGDQVVVVGRVNRQPNEVTIDAKTVIGGTWSEYLLERRIAAWSPLVFGAVFGGLSLSALLLARKRPVGE